MQDAQAQVEALKQEVGEDPGAGTRRVRAARQRAASEREQRIERALKAMAEIDKSLLGKGKKRQADGTRADTTQDESDRTETPVDGQVAGEQTAQEQPKEAKQAKKPKEPRVSTTDCEARVMKMADGGFRPAFNAQLAVDTGTLFITGVDLINSGSDMSLPGRPKGEYRSAQHGGCLLSQMLPMHEQHQDRYARVPEQWLADGGFGLHMKRHSRPCKIHACPTVAIGTS